MLTKTRTAIITLIAACGFATTTIAPAVSQAQDNSGQHAAECEVLRLTTELWEQAAVNAGNNRQWDLYNYYVAEAAATRGAAVDKGCAWVATAETRPVSTQPAVRELKASTPPPTTKPIVVKTVTLARAVG